MGPRRGSFSASDPTGVGCPANHGARRQQRGDSSAVAPGREDRTQLREPPLSQARSQQSSSICQIRSPHRHCAQNRPDRFDLGLRGLGGTHTASDCNRSAMNGPRRGDFTPVVRSGTAIGESGRRREHDSLFASEGTAEGTATGVSEVGPATPSLHVHGPQLRSRGGGTIV